ncbi:MAG TPA: hypothetical protein VF701_06545 [Thermoanaerobaculia bacterium]
MVDVAGTSFAAAVREELWHGGRLLERRLSYGQSCQVGEQIVASDRCDEGLLAIAEREMEQMRHAVAELLCDFGPRVRLIADARSDGLSSTITIRRGTYSVVTSPPHVEQDDELLRSIGSIQPEGEEVDYRGLPILWRNGTAAVLLHEAAGHPAEHGHPVVSWPGWLEVRDGAADLLAGEPPRQKRRATFRDVPLCRMLDLVVRQSGAPSDFPHDRLEILLIDGGTYEPLTGTVTISIAAADLIVGEETRRVPPFRISQSRAAIARAIAGAAGEPIRYPGVVCSREGQELVVGSAAPLLVTVFE